MITATYLKGAEAARSEEPRIAPGNLNRSERVVWLRGYDDERDTKNLHNHPDMNPDFIE